MALLTLPTSPLTHRPATTSSAYIPQRAPDGQSIPKRQKTSLPSSISGTYARNRTPSSVTASTPELKLETPVDLHAARYASSARVLTICSQLAEKYNRPLEEDDANDLNNKSALKIGVLSENEDRIWEVERFSEATNDVESGCGTTRTDTRGDIDELDILAEHGSCDVSHDSLEGFESVRQSKQIPPAQEMDPEDAKDLRESLEKESQRRDLYGDVDENDTEDLEELEDYLHDPDQGDVDLSDDLDHDEKDEVSAHPKALMSSIEPTVNPRGRNNPPLVPPPPNDESEDELAGWDADQWNAAYETFPIESDEDKPSNEKTQMSLPYTPPSSSKSRFPASSKPSSRVSTKRSSSISSRPITPSSPSRSRRLTPPFSKMSHSSTKAKSSGQSFNVPKASRDEDDLLASSPSLHKTKSSPRKPNKGSSISRSRSVPRKSRYGGSTSMRAVTEGKPVSSGSSRASTVPEVVLIKWPQGGAEDLRSQYEYLGGTEIWNETPESVEDVTYRVLRSDSPILPSPKRCEPSASSRKTTGANIDADVAS